MHVQLELQRLAGLLIFATACSAGDGTGGHITVRDSLGIEIIESAQPEWREGEGWKVAVEPILEMGLAEGDSAYLFYSVRGVRRLRDGRIAVANAGTDEVRFYDSTGVFLRSVGRSGRGPGEFRSIGRMDVREDSLFISDYGNARVSVLAPDGSHVRSTNLSSLGLAIPRTIGLFGDGSMLLWAAAAGDLEFVEGVNTAYTVYYRLDPSGTSVDTLGLFFSGEHFVVGREGGGYSSYRMPFSRRASAVVAGDAFYFSNGSDVSMTQYSRAATPLRIVRHAREARRVTAKDQDRAIEQYLSRFDENSARRVRNTYRDMPLPATMPSVQMLLVGSDGEVWVGQYTSGFDLFPACWWVFAATGQLMGSVCLPEGFVLYQIGADFLLGVSTDEPGTERVVMYGLLK